MDVAPGRKRIDGVQDQVRQRIAQAGRPPEDGERLVVARRS
jgi:hypothetical protein